MRSYCLDMKQRKPKVGDLVAVSEEIMQEEQQGLPFAGRGQVGVIVKCVGTRCRVHWTNGQKSLPQRSVLQVINYVRDFR